MYRILQYVKKYHLYYASRIMRYLGYYYMKRVLRAELVCRSERDRLAPVLWLHLQLGK